VRVSGARLVNTKYFILDIWQLDNELPQGSGFRVQGSGFRVQGSGFRVQGSGFRV